MIKDVQKVASWYELFLTDYPEAFRAEGNMKTETATPKDLVKIKERLMCRDLER